MIHHPRCASLTLGLQTALRFLFCLAEASSSVTRALVPVVTADRVGLLLPGPGPPYCWAPCHPQKHLPPNKEGSWVFLGRHGVSLDVTSAPLACPRKRLGSSELVGDRAGGPDVCRGGVCTSLPARGPVAWNLAPLSTPGAAAK